MSPLTPIIYGLLVGAASFVGGVLPSRVRLGHIQMHFVMSFVSGFMLSVALVCLLPHALESVPGEWACQVLLLGIVSMALVMRFFGSHQHEPEIGSKPNSASVNGTLLGLGIHSLVEGAALGAALGTDAAAGLLLAIVIHKPLEAYSLVQIFQAAGRGRWACLWVNALFALVCPVALLGVFWGGSLLRGGGTMSGLFLSFGAGVLLCVALSDVLPEIQSHRHDRNKLTFAFLGGGILFYILHLLGA